MILHNSLKLQKKRKKMSIANFYVLEAFFCLFSQSKPIKLEKDENENSDSGACLFDVRRRFGQRSAGP
jgi:hypothetical protein